jgi:hypothetical protein
LLSVALSQEPSPLRDRAFVLLSNCSRAVVAALIQNDLFFLRATEILASEKHESFAISRLASLFDAIVMKVRGSFVECVGFLFQMMNFIDESSVFSLFSSVCSVSPKLAELQRILATSGFANLLLNEFGSSDNDSRVMNLCAVIKVCLQNPVLRTSFTTEKVINKLSSLLETKNVLLLNQIWQAISVLCAEVTVSKMKSLQDRAFEILKIDFKDLHMYHVCAMDLLANVLKYSPNMFEADDAKQMMRIALRLLVEFPNATNLMGSVFKFLRSAIRSSGLLMTVVRTIVPVLVILSESGERTSAAAYSLQFLGDIETSRENNNVVNNYLSEDKQFSVFVKDRLKKYLRELGCNWGGPVNKYVKKSRSFEYEISGKYKGNTKMHVTLSNDR